jgi:hypothetical protein
MITKDARRGLAGVGVLTLAFGAIVSATERSRTIPPRQPPTTLLESTTTDPAADQLPFSRPTALKIENVRLTSPVRAETWPAALLTFAVVNEGAERLSDITLEISITESAVAASESPASSRAVVRPFTVRGDTILQPGYAFNFEVLLRNVSADCICVPKVDVIAAHVIID